MKLHFERSFLKDIQKRKDHLLKKRVEAVISEIRRADSRY